MVPTAERDPTESQTNENIRENPNVHSSSNLDSVFSNPTFFLLTFLISSDSHFTHCVMKTLI